MNYRVRNAILALALFGLSVSPLTVAAQFNSEEALKQNWYRGHLRPTAAQSNVNVLANWPTFQGVQQTGRLEASFNSFGQFGLNYSSYLSDVEGWPQSNFVVPAGIGPEYLYGGGIWIGGVVHGDTAVSTGIAGFTGSPEMYPPGFSVRAPRGSITEFDYASDYALRAEFSDTINDGVNYGPDFLGQPHIPLNVRIANRSHAWYHESCARLVIYDLVLTNIGDDIIEGGYVGLFFDADIGDNTGLQAHLDDVAGSIRDEGIAYMIDADGDPINADPDDSLSATAIFAAKFIGTSFLPADTSFNWWESGIYGGPGGFGPRRKEDYLDFQTGGTGTPQADVNRYNVLSTGEWDYDQVLAATITDADPVWLRPSPTVANQIKWGADTRFLLSVGPFDLDPDSSVRLIFTTATADSVVTRTDLDMFISIVPDLYDDVLNLEDLIDVLSGCDTLADLLLNPGNPTTGLKVAYRDVDSVLLEWDPWVFDEVDAYEIYATEVYPEALPYPGVMPPWLEAEISSPVATAEPTYHHTLTDLDPTIMYLINVAHRYGDQVGDTGPSLALPPLQRPPAPDVALEFTFVHSDEPASINWETHLNTGVDHFNVYRFPDSSSAIRRYHAFYDEGYYRQTLTPVDSFVVADESFYYYAMQPLAQMDSGTRSFTDPDAQEGMVYVISSVDSAGFESGFSLPVIVNAIEPRTHDILVLTHSTSEVAGNVRYDSLLAFYTDVLSPYDFAIYDYRDTTQSSECGTVEHHCFSWAPMVPFRLVIIDDGLADLILNSNYENAARGFERYLHTGGRIAYFGSLSGFNMFGMTTPPSVTPVEDPFLTRYAGLDSVFQIGGGYYALTTSPPYVDSLSGFVRAESVTDGLPDLLFDSENTPLVGELEVLWPINTAPITAAFAATDDATTLYRYRSLYPSTSLAEGYPVGISFSTATTDFYAFGFHLWYMERPGARALLDWLMDAIPTDVETPHTDLPASFALHQNYPNPFNPSTTIRFELPQRSDVTLDVFNILGRRVCRLVDRSVSAGVHEVIWDGRDRSGASVASGLYLYRLSSGSSVQTRKMLLLK